MRKHVEEVTFENGKEESIKNRFSHNVSEFTLTVTGAYWQKCFVGPRTYEFDCE